MAPLPSSLAWFDEGGDEVKTVSPGQAVELDWGELLSQADCVKTPFSGKLTLHSAGSSMNETFRLDTEDDRILTTQRVTAFYTETLVRMDGDPIGSYIDLKLGPYLKMNLQKASMDHMKVLLQRIRFAVPSGLSSPCRLGRRILTAELQEQGSGQRATAQTVVNVIAPHRME